MTTTSSLPFSAMEVPTMDDTMEMASPYQGHADDFDIDIDVMEDQASNADRDMTAADDYMDNSHGENHGQDGFPDEDMIDDVAEPSMIDADEYPDTNQNIDMQYEEGKPEDEKKIYEAEMLEDEYVEDIDAPVLEHPEEAPESLEPEHADSEDAPRAYQSDKDLPENGSENHAEPHTEAKSKDLEESQSDSRLDSGQAANRLDGEQPAEEPETVHVEPQDSEVLANNTNTAEQTEQAEQAELQLLHNSNDQDNSENSQNGSDEGDPGQPQSSNGECRELEVESREQLQVSESNDQETEQGHESTDASPLHPVKVYYQDNEISLFPPREGDASETFFLEDESLAYESFVKLFGACREVLKNHITENEVLVIDIETLNFQVTEDSLETHNFTLKQIIDVYLQLCHNDGIVEAEALYLNLSTKLTLAAELSELLIAASEGKGLSEIQSWEIYPDAEGAAEFEETAQESYSEEQPDTFEKGIMDNKSNHGSSQEPESDVTSHEQDASNSPQGDPETEEKRSVRNAEDGNVTVNASDLEDRHNASPQAPSHNLEEQNTDSSGTLEPLPVNDTPEERLQPGEVDEQSHGDENDDEDYHEDDEDDDEAHPEEGFWAQTTGSAGDPEEPEADDTGDLEEYPAEYNDLESYHEQPLSEEDVKTDVADVADAANEDDLVLKPQSEDSSNTTEPLLDGIPSEKSDHQYEVDDSPGVAEHANSSDSGSKAVDLVGVSETNEPGHFYRTPENTVPLPADADEGADLPFEDEEDYLDLGSANDANSLYEDQEDTSTSHVSGKRFREPDDEFDFPQSSTPEVKRSRSS
ncbi:hypothetical protein BDW67DRAFT_10305 [Aspergillus spinulosporus]